MAATNHILKVLSVFMLLLVQVHSYTQGTWERIDVPTNKYLKSVCFVDSLYGWIAGDSGTLLHTTNGGLTWVQQNIHSTYEVVDVFFLNRHLGWASSFNYSSSPYGTILLKTTDGGNNWVSQPYPIENIFITCILFRDSLNGWMGGMPHALVKTTDGGNHWTQAAIDTSTLAFFPVLNIQFYNEKYGYASGGRFDIAGVIWHTSNGGDLWYAINENQAPADEVHGLHIFDSLHVMGAGGDPDFGFGVGMSHTADGGLNWTYDELAVQGNAYDLDFRNDHEAWAPLGPRRKLIYSMDAGATWAAILSPDSTAIYDMIFPDSLHGFAVGKEGAVLKFHPQSMSSVQPIISSQKKYLLFQNNPNPVKSGTATIRFTIPLAGESQIIGNGNSALPLQLKVYNVLGKEVASLVNEILPSGDHEIAFDATNLPGGLYFYVLQLFAPGQSVMVAGPKRMIILN